MPKLKTNKAAKKRYSYTATNKVKRTKANRRHLLANRTTKQKRQLRAQTAYADKTCEALEYKLKDRSEKNGKSKKCNYYT